jgi:hypothetical protein
MSIVQRKRVILPVWPQEKCQKMESIDIISVIRNQNLNKILKNQWNNSEF